SSAASTSGRSSASSSSGGTTPKRRPAAKSSTGRTSNASSNSSARAEHPPRPSYRRRDAGSPPDGAQTVVGRVLVRLGRGGDVEGRVDEVVDGAFEVDDGLAQVHQLRRRLAENVHAEEASVLAGEHQLDQP